MDPDDPPKTVGVEKRPVDERNALGHGVEKSEIGIKQQDPGEDQWEIWNEISDPTERLEEFTAGHVCARDEPSENHGQNHGGNQAHNVPGSEKARTQFPNPYTTPLPGGARLKLPANKNSRGNPMATARKASNENSATRMGRKRNRLFDGAATAVDDFMRAQSGRMVKRAESTLSRTSAPALNRCLLVASRTKDTPAAIT